MARHHRYRDRETPSRWEDLSMLGWLAIAAAVIVSVAIDWAVMSEQL
jgi:hypothetical protein